MQLICGWWNSKKNLKSWLAEAIIFKLHSCCIAVLVAQLCLNLCDPMGWSLAGSSVHGVLQARTLEWVVISFSILLYKFAKFLLWLPPDNTQKWVAGWWRGSITDPGVHYSTSADDSDTQFCFMFTAHSHTLSYFKPNSGHYARLQFKIVF